jgi:hypothetical protein
VPARLGWSWWDIFTSSLFWYMVKEINMGKWVCINKHVTFIGCNILEWEQHVEFTLCKKLDEIISLSFIVPFIYSNLSLLVCWNSVGWGTALQDGGRGFDYRLDQWDFQLTYPSGLTTAVGWTHTSEYQGYLLGVKAAVAWGWQPCHHHVSTV